MHGQWRSLGQVPCRFAPTFVQRELYHSHISILGPTFRCPTNCVILSRPAAQTRAPVACRQHFRLENHIRNGQIQNVPFVGDRRPNLTTIPVPSYVRSAFRAKTSRWTSEKASLGAESRREKLCRLLYAEIPTCRYESVWFQSRCTSGAPVLCERHLCDSRNLDLTRQICH